MYLVYDVHVMYLAYLYYFLFQDDAIIDQFQRIMTK